MGQVGVVKDVMSGGDVQVNFGTNCWTFNPAVLMQVNASDNSSLKRNKDNNANRNSASRDSSNRMTSKAKILM